MFGIWLQTFKTCAPMSRRWVSHSPISPDFSSVNWLPSGILQCETLCLQLESLVQSVEEDSSSRDVSYFPITVGRKPTQPPVPDKDRTPVSAHQPQRLGSGGHSGSSAVNHATSPSAGPSPGTVSIGWSNFHHKWETSCVPFVSDPFLWGHHV